jgi:hypothetical protein
MADVLRNALNACFFQEPLEADDERRVDLHALGVRGTDHDPKVRIKTVIENADKPTQQLFSGFIGSGKSTELKRLAKDLGQAGYVPVLVDYEQYLSLHDPPRVNDLLTTAAAGVDAFIQQQCQGAIAGAFKPYLERLRNFLGSEVVIDGAKVNVPAVGEIGLKLKQDVDFKARLYQHLEESGRLSDLARQCHDYLNEAVAVVAKAQPDSRGLVIILDTFERVRSVDLSRADEMRQAIETIFVRDWKMLQLPCHVVYTVPSWLTFFEFGANVEFGRVCILPMCRLMDRETGQRVPEGFDAMRRILRKRMDLGQVFADVEPLDDLIEASGGYPRDFLRMMHEVVLSALMEKIAPPISATDLARLVKNVIRDQVRVYDKPIFDEDLPLLVEVARTHDVPRSERKQAFRLAELFDNHFVLGYRNGEEWYDLHPLVRRSPKVDAALRAANDDESNGG